MNRLEAKKNLEQALQDYIDATHGEGIACTDYALIMATVDMHAPAGMGTGYTHEYSGNMHSIMGLAKMQTAFIDEMNHEQSDSNNE